MAHIVAGELYQKLDGQLFEIKRQLRQPNGYGFNPEALSWGLQKLIDGKFEIPDVGNVIVPRMFPIAETNLVDMLAKAERFAKANFGVTVNLSERFVLPTEIPWQDVLPVFDLGTLANDDAVKTLKKLGFTVYEEEGVNKYSGSKASGIPTLHLIQNSIRPDADTMNMSPDELVETGKTWLSLRGYAVAFGFRHFLTDECLDPKTWTWFPNNRLPHGEVASGRWNPGYGQVGFGWNDPGYRGSSMGARSAVALTFRP